LWLIWYNSIATKDNSMCKRGWRGDTKCRLCDEEEDINLFLLALQLGTCGV
jgi:hypothetical protein